MNQLQRDAIAMGISLDNAIGTPEHRAKWIGKLKLFGLTDKASLQVYSDALEARHDFATFSDAVKAFAGCAHGIATAPPAGRATGARWNR